MEIESSIPQKTFFSNRSCSALSRGCFWGERSICVEPWHLVESCLQRCPDHCPDSRHLLSPRGKNLSPVRSRWGAVLFPARTDLALQERGWENLFSASDCFRKILPDRRRLLPGVRYGRSLFSPPDAQSEGRPEQEVRRGDLWLLLGRF